MSTVQVDAINESTTNAGVTVDGVLIKDSKIGGTITVPSSTGTMALTSDISAGGLEMVDIYQLTADITTLGTNSITANLGQKSGTLETTIGTGMTNTGGQFSFPTTGKYLIQVQAYLASRSNGAGDVRLYIVATDDNFSTSSIINWNRVYANANNQYTTTFSQTLVDITDISNDKIIFQSYISGDANVMGTYTTFGFYKLGET